MDFPPKPFGSKYKDLEGKFWPIAFGFIIVIVLLVILYITSGIAYVFSPKAGAVVLGIAIFITFISNFLVPYFAIKKYNDLICENNKQLNCIEN